MQEFPTITPSSQLGLPTFHNEGECDRGVRMLVGMLLLAAGWGFMSSVLGIVLVAAGVLALGTGVVGWCPAYTVFGVSTRKVTARHCPSCEAGQRL